MTEHYTIAEARELGLLDKPGTLDKRKAAVADAKAANAEVSRLKAQWKFMQQILEIGYPVRIEHRFHPTRRWRFDFAIFTGEMRPFLAIEIDGYGKGHYGIKGRENDNEKDAAARLLDWQVIRVAWKHVKDGQAIELVKRFVEKGDAA